MKILFFTKRHYMSKDLLCDKYGRFYELPEELAKLDYKLVCVCANYYHSDDNIDANNNLWRNFNFHNNFLIGLLKYYLYLREITKLEKPDLIIGVSDMFQVILSSLLSYEFKIPYIVDLYDNFESYGAAKIPLLKTIFYHAVKNADGISVISPELKEHIINRCKPEKSIVVIENAVNRDMFMSGNKLAARKKNKLPVDGIFIGMAGSISKSRGINILFDAFSRLSTKYKNLYLVLAGPVSNNVELPSESNVLYLGELTYSKIPLFLNSLDVGVILNQDDAFGKFCFPQKYFEMLSCKTPMVVSNVGVMSKKLKKTPQLLFQPDDDESLINALEFQINNSYIFEDNILEWNNQGKKLSSLIKDII